ncbi:MAG: DUF2605 domain-containing protein [Prochloraceae cyanobacterium]|nr:DUF2605 domain-containing protein [Prochloraceae cyanobacterium]
MSFSQPADSELLKAILEPLLEDFQYWFSKTRSLLELQQLPFLSAEEQADLLNRIDRAQKEVSAAKMLFEATDKKTGVDPATLIPWHHLVAECWNVARQWRSFQENQKQSLGSQLDTKE